jgi:flavin-dependent dehydrogenase
MSFDCDVLIVGGGPAGATAAACLARAGRTVVLLERDAFPRFHIGESLLASVNEVLDAIGAADLVRAAGFPRKWGACFMTGDGAVERFADFAVAPAVPRPQTWQVPRARFDELLLRHAEQSGADVREHHRVTDIAFDADGVTVAYDASGVPPGRLRGRAVIDASGRAALLARRFALRVDEPELANVAIFSHFGGVPRAGGRRAGDIRIIARNDLGWFWMIPISHELMSVGVVLPREIFKPLSQIEPEALLMQLVADTPAAAQLMRGAERRWPVRVERDFSYGARTYAGDRWIVVGDAGSFLDPVFSTGVAIAMESGLEGARAVDVALGSGDLSARAFRRFDRRQAARYRSFRRFVRGFYTREFRDLFFSADPPQRMFRSLISVFAGYWRPALVTRFWVALFFLVMRLQRRFDIVPRHTTVDSHTATNSEAVAAPHRTDEPSPSIAQFAERPPPVYADRRCRSRPCSTYVRSGSDRTAR